MTQKFIMSSQCDALARLFRDDDPETVLLVKKQLLTKGESVVPDLRDLMNTDSAIVAAHARDVLNAIAGGKASRDLEQLLGQDEEIPVEKATLLIAGALAPWIDPEESRLILDEWGGELKKRLLSAQGEPLSAMTGYLHGELSLDGNAKDYHNPDNSLLPAVLQNRTGLPLTLSLVYIFVGHRAGVPVHGVNLPGHFIARCGDTYFDPFHAGRVLSLDDCTDILSRQGLSLKDEHLESPGSREIIARMLANLRHAYELEESNRQRRMVDRWLGLVTGAAQ